MDSRPLVALLNRSDRHHPWARGQWARMAPPLYTCEAVLAEACFLVRRFAQGPDTVLELVRRNVIDVSFRLSDEIDALTRLLNKYENVPMSLADGCVVRMAELVPEATVFTLDADFAVYRKHGRQTIPVLSPREGPS